MPRKGENIYKRKDGRWEGRFIRGYGPDRKARYCYVYGHTYKEVKEKLGCAAADVACDTDCRKDPATVEVIASQWLKSQKSRVKESTYNKYSNMVHLYILPHIGKRPVASISYEEISGLCDRLLLSGSKTGTGLSPKTVSDAMSVLRNLMRYGTQLGYPCRFDINSVRIRQASREMRVLSPAEQSILYAYLTESRSPVDMGILLSLLTGMRIGEVCALRWEDISFEEHTIHVRHTMQRIQDKTDSPNRTKVVITAPKSDQSRRIIPMPQNLEMLLRAAGTGKNGYVLSADGEKYIEPRVLQYHFQRVLRKLQLRSVNYHTLRHTFATRCIEVGFDVKCLSEILGHSTVNITMNRYVHPSMKLKHEHMNRLSSLFAVK